MKYPSANAAIDGASIASLPEPNADVSGGVQEYANMKISDLHEIQEEDVLAQSYASITWMTKQLRASIDRDAEHAQDKIKLQKGLDRLEKDPSLDAALEILHRLSEEEKSELDDGAQEISDDSFVLEENAHEGTEDSAKELPKDSLKKEYRLREESNTTVLDLETEDEWMSAYTAEGRVYYYNRRTRESSWTRPTSKNAKVHSNAIADRAVLSLKVDEDGPLEIDRKARKEEILSQKGLYCCFCGEIHYEISEYEHHLTNCNSLHLHKSEMTQLYQTFQRMLCILSEDRTLRCMHYASAFPEPKPATETFSPSSDGSIRESLKLLKIRRSSVPRIDKQRRAKLQNHMTATSNCGHSDKRSRDKKIGLRHQKDEKSVSTEICRHCKRKFAEGRLAKHESVCPRVFGKQTTWNKPALVHHDTDKKQGCSSIHLQAESSKQVKAAEQCRNKRNLALTYKEYQTSLVECPSCKRTFAPSGAQQHIDICKEVQHRPRNAISTLRGYAVAG